MSPSSLDAHPNPPEDEHVWALLRAYRDEPVPDGFADRVLAAAGMAPVLVGHGAARRTRVLALAASLLLALGVGAVVGRATAPTGDGPASSPSVAALDALPAGILDDLDDDALARLAGLSDAEFSALLLADPQDLSGGGN